jgi:hypothetical protein
METKISPKFWILFRTKKLSSEEKMAALWAMIGATQSGFVPDDEEQMKFDTGCQASGALSSAMTKLGHSKIDGGWVMVDYITRQIGFGDKLARDGMGLSIVKELSHRCQEMQSIILNTHPCLKPKFDELMATGKIKKLTKMKNQQSSSPTEGKHAATANDTHNQY